MFQRLTDPNRFGGSHRYRFGSDGAGLGLEGRRDDEDYKQVIAGKAMITRDIDPV